jgi:RNA polymerase sigma factor (sigma-70 family)
MQSLLGDTDLVRALLEDQPAAWRCFVRRADGLIASSIERVVRRARVLLGAGEHDEIRARFLASLLAHDRKKLRAFDPGRGATLATWIGLLAERCAFDYLRSTKAHRRVLEVDERTSGGAPSPEELVLRKQRVTRVLEAARALPRRQRELFDLCFDEGLSSEAIAARMGTSVQTVHAGRQKVTLQLSRALRKPASRPAHAARNAFLAAA